MEDLFYRGLIALVVSIFLFFRVKYRYEEEMGLGIEQNKNQKYLPYIPGGILVGVVLGRILYVWMQYGIVEARSEMISICFEMFLHISMYYVVLLLTFSVFRKWMNARACATLWMLPNALYILFRGTTPLQKPLWIMKLPGNSVEIVFAIWFIGFMMVLFRGIVLHMKFRFAVLENAKKVESVEILAVWNEEIANAMMHYKEYPLMVSENVKTPFSVGLFRSAICVILPEKEYSKEELTLIFRHELIHIGREDSWNKFMILFCTAMCWWNPMMWIAMEKNAEDLELSCDETVLLGADDSTRRRYAKLLLHTAGDESGFTTCLSSKAKVLKYRLENIVKPRVRNSGAFALAVTLFVLCMSCGHISLAYGEYTGKEVVYHSENINRYEIKSLYFTGNDPMNSVVLKCMDEVLFHKYIAGLKVQKMTGDYTFTDSSKMLKFVYETTDGDLFVELTDETIRILSQENDFGEWYTYSLSEKVDWEYFESILELDRKPI